MSPVIISVSASTGSGRTTRRRRIRWSSTLRPIRVSGSDSNQSSPRLAIVDRTLACARTGGAGEHVMELRRARVPAAVAAERGNLVGDIGRAQGIGEGG